MQLILLCLTVFVIGNVVCERKVKLTDVTTEFDTSHTLSLPSWQMSSLHDLYDSTNGDFWFWRNSSKENATVRRMEEYMQHVDPSITVEILMNLTLPFGSIWNFTGVHDPCAEQWQGVNCTCSLPSFNSTASNCSVVALDLVYYNLTGTLPFSILNLTDLRVLNLQDNNITGTIPLSVGNLSHLTVMALGKNLLSGALPRGLSNLSELIALRLDGNHFRGPIPDELCHFPVLQVLNLSTNALTGPIPAAIGDLASLRQLFLMYNHLSGTVPPEMGQLHEMTAALLSQNRLEGTLSEAFSHMPGLTFLTLDHNSFEGSIPAWLGNLTQLLEVALAGNALTGSIPPSVCGMRRMTSFIVNDNLLSGSVPACIGDMGYLLSLSLYNNHLHGSLPSSMSSLRYLSLLFLSNNHFSGAVPTFKNCKNLQFLYLQDNHFNGPLGGLVNASVQSLVSYVDVSDNEFTGPVDTELFRLASLVSFAAVSNCLTGTVPTSLCNLTYLTFVNLDGMHTGSACHRKILPKLSSSYILSKATRGGIPQCLFESPTLETLHLSGNGIQWSFPSSMAIGPQLRELSLSYNLLHGTIPAYVQERDWQSLDLSYNRLGGSLSPAIAVGVDSSLSLQVNRLSGDIPASLKHALSLNVLTSNLFFCDFQRSSLPVNDQYYKSYQCGSDNFMQSFVVWSAVVAAELFVAALFAYTYFTRKHVLNNRFSLFIKHMIECYQQWMSVFDSVAQGDSLHAGVYRFGDFMGHFRNAFLLITSRLLVMFIPLNYTLGRFYRTHEYEYAWQIAAMYLSGEVPATVLFAVFTLFLAHLLNTLRVLIAGHKFGQLDAQLKQVSHTYNFRRNASMFCAVLLNCVLMVGLNSVYVYFVLDYSSRIVVIIQIAIASVKLLWNDIVLRHTIKLARRFYLTREEYRANRLENARDMPMLSFIVIFNSIIAPFLANAGVSRSCFCDVFIQSPDVDSVFPFHTCSFIHSTEVSEVVCPTQIDGHLSMSYSPPFFYNFQCASSFVRNYAGVFVYMFLIDALVQPLIQVALKFVYERSTPSSFSFRAVDFVLYRLLKPPKSLADFPNQMLFHKERFVLKAVSATSVLITLGVVFPPISAIICVAIFSQCYVTQLLIGRFLSKCDPADRQRFSELIGQDCDGVAESFMHSLKSVIPFTAMFYAFFVFDIYADDKGWRQAMWVTVVLFCAPLNLYLIFKLYYYGRAQWSSTAPLSADKITVVDDDCEAWQDKQSDVEMLGRVTLTAVPAVTQVEEEDENAVLNPVQQ